MGLDERIQKIRGISEEIINEDDLRELLEKRPSPIAYDGFEPSGLATLPLGIFLPIRIQALNEAGILFKILIADTFAQINNKMGGDLEKIRTVGKYFMEVWKAAGVDMDKVTIIWHKEFFDNPEYWRKALLIARSHTLTRTKKALTIAGRREGDDQQTALFFYPTLQCADVFHIGADICQLGLDQRKVNMLAREIGGMESIRKELGYDRGVNGKPVIISHHMLMGLSGARDATGFDENYEIDRAISSKMSKSDPESAIYVHDDESAIRRKIEGAYCPPRTVEGNPILDYSKELILRAFNEFEIQRPQKFGGNITYTSFEELRNDYLYGKLHPMDLKNGVIDYVDRLISPIRTHFERSRSARRFLEQFAEWEKTK